MSNVPTDISIKKTFAALGIAALGLSLGTSCGPSEQEKARQEAYDQAKDLASQIDKAIDSGEYATALALIDSLNATYTDNTELRLTTIQSRARAIEGQMLADSIPWADSLMTTAALQIDSLTRLFTAVNVPGFDTYLVSKDVYDPAFTRHTAVQPRLGNSTTPWTLAVNIAGQAPCIAGIDLVADGNTLAGITAPDADARRITTTGGEMFSFGPEEATVLAQAIAGTDKTGLTIVVKGKKSNVSISLSPVMAEAICRTALLADLKEVDRQAHVKRELYERKLIVARDQLANSSDAAKQ